MKNVILSLLLALTFGQTSFARTLEIIKDKDTNQHLSILSSITKMHMLNLGTFNQLGEDVRIFESLEGDGINPTEVYIVLGNGIEKPIRNYIFGERIEGISSIKKTKNSIIIKYSVHTYDQNGDDLSVRKTAIVKLRKDGNLEINN